MGPQISVGMVTQEVKSSLLLTLKVTDEKSFQMKRGCVTERIVNSAVNKLLLSLYLIQDKHCNIHLMCIISVPNTANMIDIIIVIANIFILQIRDLKLSGRRIGNWFYVSFVPEPRWSCMLYKIACFAISKVYLAFFFAFFWIMSYSKDHSSGFCYFVPLYLSKDIFPRSLETKSIT